MGVWGHFGDQHHVSSDINHLMINDSNNTCTCLKQAHISFYFYWILNLQVTFTQNTADRYWTRGDVCKRGRGWKPGKSLWYFTTWWSQVRSLQRLVKGISPCTVNCLCDIHLSSRTSCSYFGDLLGEEIICQTIQPTQQALCQQYWIIRFGILYYYSSI